MAHKPLTISLTYNWSHKVEAKSYFTDKDHGVRYRYNEHGMVISSTVLCHGKRVHSKEWYHNGKLAKRTNWANSALHGICEMWNPAGTIQLRTHYKQGKLNGTTTRWKTEDGKHQLSSIQTYKDNLLHGLQIHYHRKNYATYYFSINGVDHTEQIKMIVKDIKNITAEELTLIGILHGF